MNVTARRTSAAVAVAATAGVSTLFVGVAPAIAAPSSEACGDTGAVVAAGICEQTYTSGSATLTPTADMTKLEVLLVGAGGAGMVQPDPNTNGYATAGGGGEVKIVDFTGATSDLEIDVPTPASPGGVTSGAQVETVANGVDGSSTTSGGASGSGNAGATGNSASPPTTYGAGGGAASAASGANGGAGVVVSTIALSGSLFAADSHCYGGGGAVGISGVQGIPGCGGGGPSDATGANLTAAAANSGGGGGGVSGVVTSAAVTGADGVVVVRWTAADVTLSFDANGHGTAPSAQTIPAGTVVGQPTAPTESGFDFKGWYTDASLTTLADFSAPVIGSTTYFAKWAPALAATGGAPSPVLLPLGLAVLLAGAALATAGALRRRREN